MLRKTLSTLILIILIPLLIAVGITSFNDRRYNLIIIGVSVLLCTALFIRFERKNINIRLLVTITVLIALSVIGRILFAPFQFFKPVTAMAIITAIYLGPELGFTTGALAALISNMYFGQGPWTPFQMLVWGIIGFLSGFLGKNKVLSSVPAVAVFSALFGVFFSLAMDIWTTVSADGAFVLGRYLSFVITAIPVTVTYMVSNVIFILILYKPIGNILKRIDTKYGLNINKL